MAVATSTALLIAAGASAAGSVAGGAIQSGAQGRIAQAQGAAADRMRQESLQFAAPTSQELENIQKQTALYDRMYAQQTALIDQAQKQIMEAYGPSIMEQGRQFFNQLKGEASGVVRSFDNQRSRAREQLRAQLIERMGPDALTSSAGVNALNNFDIQTADARSSIEEQSLNNAVTRLGNLQQSQGAAGSTIYNAYNSMSGLLNNIQTTMGNIQTRQVNASNMTAAPVIGTAGSENVGTAYMGQAIQGGFQQAGQLAGYGMMANALERSPASAPSSQAQQTQLAGGFNLRPSSGINMGPSSYQNPWEAPQYSTAEPTFGDFTFNGGSQ